jgi:hypothetical protein
MPPYLKVVPPPGPSVVAAFALNNLNIASIRYVVGVLSQLEVIAHSAKQPELLSSLQSVRMQAHDLAVALTEVMRAEAGTSGVSPGKE